MMRQLRAKAATVRRPMAIALVIQCDSLVDWAFCVSVSLII